ncbi:DNA primase [Paramicrosporidium saccamoebae]|uniref:DNA primase n=1 Tax=Paramicrosporidium saccamoebae TaxID=1246581 RepID=A0A2H9TG35_9FUNG|nr:DNA primase [Paramicrosporidium saccamoebae]
MLADNSSMDMEIDDNILRDCEEFIADLDSQVSAPLAPVQSPTRPTERKTLAGANFCPLERELVFDIDMTDYNDVRTCCQYKASITISNLKGQERMQKMLEILGAGRQDYRCRTARFRKFTGLIVDDFGFENILWVFSGRRGVHCWVSDARARQMSLSARKSIVSYLEMAKVAI